MRPSIDHSLLSPSGHISKRTRNAALERARAALFPDGFWDKEQKNEDMITQQRQQALRQATTLRDLAKRGMHPRKYAAEADQLEQEWL